MRSIFSAAALLTLVVVTTAVAQTTASPDSNAAQPSLLAPRVSDAPPPPAPIAPENNERPAPQAVAPAPEAPPPAPDLGTVTAVPLAPPGTTPPRPPAAEAAPGPATIAASPATGVPISLAPPRPAPHTLEPIIQSGAAKAATAGLKSPAVPLVSNKLPEPPLSSEASPADFLRAARGALAAGRNGEARSALEMAQTRLLDRVVDAGTEQQPSNNTAVKQISEAIDALVANDRMACLRYIQFASETLGTPLD